MPIIQITLIEGRESKDIENCMRNVAQTVHESLNTPLENIKIMVNEVAPNRFSSGTKLISEIRKSTL